MLIPAIDQLLVKQQWGKEELTAVAVGVGPGSFTGVRTGVVTARTLCCALGLPLLGVSLFECIAYLAERPTGVVLSCGKAFYFAAVYADDTAETPAAEGSRPIFAPAYISAAELTGKLALAKKWLADKQALQELTAQQASPHSFLPLPEISNTAVIQAQIACERLACVANLPSELAAWFHWSKIEPLYLRGPSVTIKR